MPLLFSLAINVSVQAKHVRPVRVDKTCRLPPVGARRIGAFLEGLASEAGEKTPRVRRANEADNPSQIPLVTFPPCAAIRLIGVASQENVWRHT
jgi:hypothetical protein